MNKATVAVIGSGSWGTAVAISLARNGHPVRIWGPEHEIMTEIAEHHRNSVYLPGVELPALISASQTAEAALAGVDTVIFVVPSHVFRRCLIGVKPYFSPNIQIAWGTKGLDPDSDQFMHEIVKEVMGDDVPMAVISGPSFAMEVANNLPTAVNLAATTPEFASLLKSYFQVDLFQVVILQDMIGLQLAGCMKNVIAIATGIADGLGYGSNTQAALITLGLQEMQRLGKALGADPETFMHLGGIGDLVLTCSDNQSRNRRFGKALGQGHHAEAAMVSIGQVVEGAFNAKQVHRLAMKYNCELTICKTIYELIFEEKALDLAMKKLFHFS